MGRHIAVPAKAGPGYLSLAWAEVLLRRLGWLTLPRLGLRARFSGWASAPGSSAGPPLLRAGWAGINSPAGRPAPAGPSSPAAPAGPSSPAAPAGPACPGWAPSRPPSAPPPGPPLQRARLGWIRRIRPGRDSSPGPLRHARLGRIRRIRPSRDFFPWAAIYAMFRPGQAGIPWPRPDYSSSGPRFTTSGIYDTSPTYL
jgi:hypothetical protein